MRVVLTQGGITSARRGRVPRRSMVIAALVLGLLSWTGVAARGAPLATQPGDPGYLARDVQNIADAYGRQTGPNGQLSNPAYLPALATQTPQVAAEQLLRLAVRPNRPALTAGTVVPGFSVGDPLRQGWDRTRGTRVPVSFTTDDGALLSGNVFAPRPGATDPYTGAPLRAPYPGVVVAPGSAQASQQLYFWLAEDLAERGYLVLLYDQQGQGQSETLPHTTPVEDLPLCHPLAPPASGELTGCPGVPSQQSSNFTDTVTDAIDFFFSTPDRPHPRTGTGSTAVDRHNPLWALYDRRPLDTPTAPGRTARFALAGHSFSAFGASQLQSSDPRISTVVAMDKLSTDGGLPISGPIASVPGPVVPTVPALALQADYGFEPVPYTANHGSSLLPAPRLPTVDPDPRREQGTGFDGWRGAGVDTMLVVPRASTHLDWNSIPLVLPASRWGQAMSSYYVQAWLDKYLAADPTADDRLLATEFTYREPVAPGPRYQSVALRRDDQLSIYFCSGYDFTRRDGGRARDTDLGRAGCPSER